MPPSKQAPRKVKAAARRQDILARRADGLTYKALAAEFGLSQRRVREIVAEEFALLNAARAEAAEAALALSLGRLDKLLEAVWDEAMEGDLEAVKTAASVIEKQAKLMGLGAAKPADPASPVATAPSLEQQAQALGLTLEALRGPSPPRLVEVIDMK